VHQKVRLQQLYLNLRLLYTSITTPMTSKLLVYNYGMSTYDSCEVMLPR